MSLELLHKRQNQIEQNEALEIERILNRHSRQMDDLKEHLKTLGYEPPPSMT